MRKIYYAAIWVMIISLLLQQGVFAAEYIPVYDKVISVAEFDGEYATIAGKVPIPNSSVTVEVLSENGRFENVNDMSDINTILANFEYFTQVSADNDGYYQVRWRFTESAEGTYPVRIYYNEGKSYYTSELKIGEADAKVNSISYHYEDENGNTVSNAFGASELVINAKLAEISGRAEQVIVAVAEYDTGNDMLCDVSYETAKVYGNSVTEVTLRKRLKPYQRRIKVFVWDNLSNMYPLGEQAEFVTDLIVAPTGAEIYSDLIENIGEGVHPRILAPQQSFDEIKARIETDSTTQAQYHMLSNFASRFDASYDDASYTIEDGYSLLSVADIFLIRMRACCMMYKLSDDEQWAQKAWKQLELVANFPDWNEQHFLDTAHIAMGVAIGYDWLYDYLNEEQKQLLVNAVKRYAFDTAMDDYTQNPDRQRTFEWSVPENANNWNLVCNGGIMCAAIAMLDEPSVSEYAQQILDCGMTNILSGISLYSPTGDWEEGLMYWALASKFLGYFIETLDTACGTDYKYSEAEGIEESFNAVLAMTGPAGVFNYHESTENLSNRHELYWFAHKYKNPSMYAYLNGIMNVCNAEMLLWNDNAYKDSTIEYPTDYYGEKNSIVSMRSSSDKDATYAAFHSGSNSVSHSQFDIGQFIIDSQGERFVKDLGKEDYSVSKWLAYRNRAEGHNTLVINPGSGDDQFRAADCQITEHGFGSTSYAISDITKAYIDSADSIQRGVKLTDDRSVVVVRDEIKLKKASELYWFAHTDAEITLSDDKKSAVLGMNGKYMQARILEGSNAEFEIMDAKPLPTSPNVPGQSTNNCKKLAIHLTGFTQGAIEVGFAPIASKTGNYSFASASALDTWNVNNR